MLADIVWLGFMIFSGLRMVYAAAGLHNTWLALASAIYAACCVTVIVLTMLKRSGWRIRVTSPLL